MTTLETIEWQTGMPDADTTVLIELDPAGQYSEPVYLGYWDGHRWLDVNGEEVRVIAWAHPPKGSRWILLQLPVARQGNHLPGGGGL